MQESPHTLLVSMKRQQASDAQPEIHHFVTKCNRFTDFKQNVKKLKSKVNNNE
jgi:hypothetical protein